MNLWQFKHLKVKNNNCVCQSKYSKTVKNGHSQRQKIGSQDQLSLNAGQKYCIMLQGEHFAILSTFIKLPFVNKIFVFSIVEWPFYTGFTVVKDFLWVDNMRSVRSKPVMVYFYIFKASLKWIFRFLQPFKSHEPQSVTDILGSLACANIWNNKLIGQ